MEKNTVKDVYEDLLKSQIEFIVKVDPDEKYTHLSDDEKDKVMDYMINDTYSWDLGPIVKFINENLPATFEKGKVKDLGITFDHTVYLKGDYPEEIEEELYRNYLLNFTYDKYDPVDFTLFKNDLLKSKEYLKEIDGLKL